jgi:hypothetical protein
MLFWFLIFLLWVFGALNIWTIIAAVIVTGAICESINAR